MRRETFQFGVGLQVAPVVSIPVQKPFPGLARLAGSKCPVGAKTPAEKIKSQLGSFLEMISGSRKRSEIPNRDCLCPKMLMDEETIGK